MCASTQPKYSGGSITGRCPAMGPGLKRESMSCVDGLTLEWLNHEGVREYAIGMPNSRACSRIPLQTIRPRLRILGKQDKMPSLPELEFIPRVRETDTRPTPARRSSEDHGQSVSRPFPFPSCDSVLFPANPVSTGKSNSEAANRHRPSKFLRPLPRAPARSAL